MLRQNEQSFFSWFLLTFISAVPTRHPNSNRQTYFMQKNTFCRFFRCGFYAALFFVASSCFSQPLSEVRLDENVSAMLPPGYERTDTADLIGLSAELPEGFLILLRSKQKDTLSTVESEADLEAFSRNAALSVERDTKGKVVRSVKVKRDGLVCFDFEIRNVPGNEAFVFHALVFRLDNCEYSYMFVPNQEVKDAAKAKAAIYARLKFRKGLTIDNQFNHSVEASRAYRMGSAVGTLLAPVLLVGIIAAVIIIIVRSRRNAKKRKRALSDVGKHK